MKELNELLVSPTFRRIAAIAIGAIVVLVAAAVAKRALNRTIKSTDNKYKARKAVTLSSYLLLVVVVLFVYSDKLGNVGVALGVAGAGIAFALQEVIVSLAGWLTIVLTSSISVGQRIKVGEVKGDIIDIGILTTTIMEVGDWVDGDLYNGRIVSLANSFVFKGTLHNYSAEYPFLWDELTVPIRLGSDFHFARGLFENVLNEICGDYAAASEQGWHQLANRYRVEEARVKPMVALRFDENWITFTLRYVVDYKMRRSTKDRIFTRLLDEIAKHPDRISIAASTLEITVDNEDENPA